MNKKKLLAHGVYPSYVYKAFNEREYLEWFIDEGKFRLGNLRTYKSIEDLARRDNDEGTAVYRRPGMVTSVAFSKDNDDTFVTEAPGHINTHTELGNPKFVFCTSLPNVNLQYMKERFGKYIVKITEPKTFAQDISQYLYSIPTRFAGGIEGIEIQYNRNEIIEKELDNKDRVTLSYSQKSFEFKDETEFRFVALVLGTPSKRYNEDYLDINIGKRLQYVDIV